MTTTPHPTRLDRANTGAALYRVAICAFTYHADKHLDEPGYQLAEDLDWCLAPLAALPITELAVLRNNIATLITTPTADRQAFIRALATLSDDASEGL
ncbi:hypothetical protein MRBLMI12_001752 [Microbacterium sp. LMI12-1-1.1]|uniref:hypothetical protein n=1 Tax=Microbacterium sp. LMI12-1-1.1 TaxID=3135225 RepID=UPI00342A0352